MDVTITPGKLQGEISAIASKSQAHRLLICAALGKRQTQLLCLQTNADIEATAACLRALGAKISRTPEGYQVIPIGQVPEKATLPCGESGSTLRFLLPVAGALGVDATFELAGRLPQRPVSPLWEELERMGCRLSRPGENAIRIQGRLHSGDYAIAGNVSSQFVSGLLFALPFLDGDSTLGITGPVESEPYIQMTLEAMSRFHLATAPTESGYFIPGNQWGDGPAQCQVEGDWSNGAFFLAANALGSKIRLTGLSADSCQGDRAIAALLPRLEQNCAIDCRDIPDLVPVLSVVAGAKQGARFTGVSRLRLKESDRLQTVAAMLAGLGGRAQIENDCLTVFGTGYTGGTVDSAGDHRIAMAAAVASTVCSGQVVVQGAEAVQKSYPQFWTHFKMLGGKL